MIDLGLSRISKRVEEISVAAGKEYALEKSLKRMKVEWSEVEFTFVPYR